MNTSEEIFYQLTYFDTGLNRRVKYLNGTSWKSIESAEEEYELIKKQEKLNEKSYCYSSRSKWALEAIKNGRRKLLKMF